MPLRRQWFKPGRHVEQISKLASHPLFSRRKSDTAWTAAAASTAASSPSTRRRVLPALAENIGALFSIVISAVLIAAIGALVYAFVRDIRRDAVELDNFTAPKEMVDRGYTSTAIAEAILDEIREIQNNAFTLQTRRQLEVAAILPDVQVAGSGVSMKSIVRYARRLVDLPDNRISGDVVQDGKALKLTLRIRERNRTEPVIVRRDDGDVDRLLRDAGRAIVQSADPYLLAVYFYGKEVKARKFSETRIAIDHALAHGSSSDREGAYHMLGDVERQEGRPDGALDAYRRFAALDLTWGTPAVVAQLVRMGRDDEALTLARERIAAAQTADEFIAAASMMAVLGRYRDELDYSRQALARNPKDPEAFNGVAVALLDLHRPAEALKVSQRGLKLNPDDHDLPSTVAYDLVKSGRPVEALEVCNASLETWAGDLWCREMRGNAYAALGRHDEAIAEYRYAQDRGNNSPYLATDYGNLLLRIGKPDEALEQYQAALTAVPRFWPAHTGWARAQLASGRAELAAARFAATAKEDPDDPLLYREWARALDALGRKDEASARRGEADQAEARLKTPLPLD